ncbi:TfuA-like protein [Nonomuraea guangzhouensis]|uniref:TfuA-like protein n=1 Tax=Nonomuraea guangzhouensis TaxID=1291555 RepID=A0ABW4GV90_9ACTN|nr:TfuA-like protein [Nonomuraea guangzhouensis]
MSRQKTVVYAGPTISHDEVRAVLPEARTRPPVARGDLLREEWGREDTAVIIDGYDRERLSVGHKEILWLLNEGVNVIGAASMGALRAAELSPYGMRGVGSVFRMYASGEVDGDDEVAVLHGPAERGYPTGTVAMVNIRYGCQEGARTGLVPAAAGERIVETAKSRPFVHRTWPELEEALGPESGDALSTLERMIGTGEWDLKRLDAVAALSAVGRHRAEAPSAWAADAALTGITHYEALAWRSMREYAPGRWMSDLDVLDAARLFGEDYPELHEQVLTGLLTDFAGARGLGLEAYTRARLGVDDHAGLSPSLASWLSETERDTLPAAEQLRLIMVRVWPVWQSEDWRPIVLARIRESSRWSEWSDLVARADETAEQTRGRLVVPAPATCGRIFSRRWNGPGTSAEVELARRGFLSMTDLGQTVSRFFALEVRTAEG